MDGWQYKFSLAGVLSSFLLSNVMAANNAPITIYTAKKIITMNAMQPYATAVAVKEGKIYSVGSLAQMKTWMQPHSYIVNTKYQNDIMTPGMIEPHAHFTMLAIFMAHPYVGYWDFPGFNSTVIPAVKTKQAVLEKLKEADKKLTDPNAVLFAWGYDPIYFNNQDLTAADLDSISTTRPIFVLNASEHIGYVNSVLLNRAGYNEQTTIQGVEKDVYGKPNGVLKEMDAAGPVIMQFFNQLFTEASFKDDVYGLAKTAHQLGLTTYSDMLFGGPGEQTMVKVLQQAAQDDAYPERMVVVYNGMLLSLLESKSTGGGVAHIRQLMQLNAPKLHFGDVKFVIDGSIQGFTARLKWPGYFNGAANGLYNIRPDELQQVILPFWRAGFPIHLHVNGNQATEAALNAIQGLQNTAHRVPTHAVLEHDQLSSIEQFQRAHDLGAYVDLFANQLYYWGDQQYSIVLGPDHANDMDDAQEAKRQGLIYGIHSDSPVTPLGPLHLMWAAMNRKTATGRTLGASEKLSAEDALQAVTLNAAYLLNKQAELGSIEIGKRADFTVLKRDPLVEPSMTVKDIPVAATIVAGMDYPS